MRSNQFPESYRDDMKETVKKTLTCITQDLGYATSVVKNIRRIGYDKLQEMIFNVPH